MKFQEGFFLINKSMSIFTILVLLPTYIAIQQDLNVEKSHRGAFVSDLVLKMIPIGIYLGDSVLNDMLTATVINELLFLFVVIQFWITKNYTGRMMAGIRWGFQTTAEGVQRLKFQYRVNAQVVPSLHFKLFWLLQTSYFIVPIILVLTQFFISSNVSKIHPRLIILNLITLIGSTINLFMFFRGYLIMNEKRYLLKYKLGRQYIRRLGHATMVTYT